MGLNLCGLLIFTTLADFMCTILAWITNIVLEGREVGPSNYCQFHTLARPMKSLATEITLPIITPIDALWAFIDSSSYVLCPFSSLSFTPRRLQPWTIASKWQHDHCATLTRSPSVVAKRVYSRDTVNLPMK